MNYTFGLYTPQHYQPRVAQHIIDAYQADIDRLANQLGCRLEQADNREGMMWVEYGFVSGPTITNQIDYLIMLHELGHYYHGHTQGRPLDGKKTTQFYFDNGVFHSEAQAWEYALDHCNEEIQVSSRRFAWDECLGAYYQCAVALKDIPTRLGNGDRQYVEFVYDQPDEYFAGVVKRIQGGMDGFRVALEAVERGSRRVEV